MNSVTGCEIQRYNHFVKSLTDFFWFSFSLIYLYYCKHVYLVMHNEQI